MQIPQFKRHRGNDAVGTDAVFIEADLDSCQWVHFAFMVDHDEPVVHVEDVLTSVKLDLDFFLLRKAITVSFLVTILLTQLTLYRQPSKQRQFFASSSERALPAMIS